MSERIAAVVLAGGLGTRLRSVLPDLPKPMAPVAGRPFVEWVIRYLAAQGVREVIISTGYRADVFAGHFAQQIPGIECIRCVAEPEPLGTAGGFLFAVNAAASRATAERPDRWLVLNGDSLVLADLAPLLHTGADAALLALWMEDAARYGSLDISADDRLLGFREKRPGASWINAGVYLVSDHLLPSFPSKRPLSWETDVFPQLLASGHAVQVHRTRAPFLDIGLPETLAQAEEFIGANGSALACNI